MQRACIIYFLGFLIEMAFKGGVGGSSCILLHFAFYIRSVVFMIMRFPLRDSKLEELMPWELAKEDGMFRCLFLQDLFDFLLHFAHFVEKH